MDLTGVRRKTNGDDPSTNTALSRHEFYDIYLWASSKDTDHFRKMNDYIHSNGWKMTSCFDHKLGELVTQTIENALLKCSHVVCLITKDDCKTNNIKQLMTIEMAIQSLPNTTEKGLEGRVIPIRCDIPESSLSPTLRALTGASIEDRDLEKRLRKSINTNIRKEREGGVQNVSGCSVSQPETDVTGKRRNVNMSSSRPSTTKGCDHEQRELDEIRKQLDEKRVMLEEIKQRHKLVESKLNAVSKSSSKHIQTISSDIKEKLEDEQIQLRLSEIEKKKKIREINEDANKQILAINEKRKRMIEACEAGKELERKIIKDKEAKLSSCLSNTDAISKIVGEKITDLTSKIQNAMKDIESTIKRINLRDETLGNEAPKVLASIDENLSLNVHQDVSDCLDRIKSEVERVKFVEGEVGGEYYGRIDGYIGKWELVKSINIASVVNDQRMRMRGLVSDDEIFVQNEANEDLYVANISTHLTEKVTVGYNTFITSCAPIDSNRIVCGNYRRHTICDTFDGFVTLYDRQWKVIRDIEIPRDVEETVSVDVDGDGMIIAAQVCQSNIYVINPANGEIVNTIMMQGKKVRGEIQALSSGDIVVKTDDDEYTVISRSGEEKTVIHCHERDDRRSECRIDKLTDTLLIVYWDRARNTYAVDQVSHDGIIQARRIVEYVKSDSIYCMSPCLVTPSGNLIGWDGDKLLLYQKTFIL